MVFRAQGKLQEAKKMFERVLGGQEMTLGPEHAHTLASVNNLALALNSMGNLQEAREMYERVLGGYKRILGPEHACTYNISTALPFS